MSRYNEWGVNMYKLDENSSIPLHHQLYRIILKDLNEGKYRPYEYLMSEKEMQETYGVSRITIRRSIGDLVNDGYLERKHGVGTYVLPPKEVSDVNHLVSFSKGVTDRGDMPGSVILKQEVTSANAKVASKLEINLGDPIISVKRLRLINGIVIGYQKSYLSMQGKLNGVLPKFTNMTSIYSFLSSKGIELKSAEETIEARMPNDDIKNILHIEDEPILCRSAISFDTDGLPVEYSENFYIASRYKYSIKVGER